MPLVMLVCGAVYWAFGLYRGVWRFASLPDLVRITKAVAATARPCSGAVRLSTAATTCRARCRPCSCIPAGCCWRAHGCSTAGSRTIACAARHRVLIVGAGRAGEMLVRDMRRDGARRYDPVAFVDDKPRRQGGDIHGVPIKGGTDRDPAAGRDLAIDLIMLAMPSASAAEMQRLVELCERTGKPFRTVPQLQSLLTGQVSINQLRPVSIEDLLGRNPGDAGLGRPARRARRIAWCWSPVPAAPSARSSAGRWSPPGRVGWCWWTTASTTSTAWSRSSPSASGLDFGRYLLDVGDRTGVDALFARERPQIVFHAAAYKHVPLLEDQLRAAVRNNVLGTGIVAEAPTATAASASC
jgi:FlaA1/EpsC-like NDP-sugar epimerase